MSLDTVKPKGMLIASYDRLSQILIDPMEFESDPVQSAPSTFPIAQVRTRSPSPPLISQRRFSPREASPR